MSLLLLLVYVHWFWVYASDSFVLLLTPFNLTVEGCKRNMEGKKKEAKIPFKFQFYFRVLLSLEWPVWSSLSGNNCHAVYRSLSSGASLWSVTFTLSHIISRAHLRDFFRLLAIGMCHFRYLRNSLFDRHAIHRSLSSGASLFLWHSENFYLVSYCEPSCILQFIIEISFVLFCCLVTCQPS